VDFAQFAAFIYPSYPVRLAHPLLFSLLQMVWDHSDSNGYAENMTDNPLPDTPAHKVLMQVAYGDHQVTNWAAAVEARTIGAQRYTPTIDKSRLNSPDGDPFYGIPAIKSYPFDGSAIVFWDSGPVRDNGSKGTAPPPLINVPDQAGQDPHELPRSDKDARRQKSAFLKPGGKVINVCGNHPCYDDDYKGP
jgi:hypothetical protein